jgi:hypothetical protein
MAQALESTHAAADQIQFELDSVELTANRLTISGRWYGVRGRRFVRPTLTLRREGERVRLLADLDHKPWAAQDGAPWTAAFPCETGLTGADDIELAVAPDVAVQLRPADSAPPQAGAKRVRAEAPRPRAAHDAIEAKLREERARAESARTELQSALARRDAAVAKLDAVIGERDAVIGERDEAAAAAERVRQELAAADRGRDTALRARDAALRDREQALRERERALRDRDAAERERERAIERFRRLRANAQARLGQLQDQVRREPRGPRPVEPRSPRPTVEARSPRPTVEPRRHSDWLARGLALAVILAVVIALFVVLQSP